MAARRKTGQREAQLTFEALSIEGALISPEWLARVAQLDAGKQTDADYRIPKGLNLRDEIGRYWRIAQAHWADFAHAHAAGTATRQVTEQFVTALLKDCLGFGSLAARVPVTKGERTFPLAWAALESRVPVVIVAPRPSANAENGSALDDLSPELGDAGRRRSAFGLAQEYLNAGEDTLWAVVCDGLTLRLCRDNASLTRPAWIEADLDRIFREERYSDFAALWLLAHETRFGAAGQLASDCPLEAWRAAGREEGTRAREFLRDGVEEALVALGKGFLANPENQALRAALHDGKLSANEYFQELLRLVYRLIFLLTVEERDLLHPAGVPDAVKARYAQGYGLRRLRDRAVKRSAHDRFGDLWEALKIVLRGVGNGEPRLGLPALGGLFAAHQCPHLDAARLENRALLTAVFRLSWLKGDSGLARVNWRDMGPEELGSVYESLLELVPVIPPDHRGFSFATGDETKGNARKTTGSYYTPDSLVQVLLDAALEPVIKATVTGYPDDPVEALLELTIVDPACGSGHFLLAAGRRLAVHVARYQAKGTPSAEQYRHAVRQVVSRCLYGVDLNPMAVELCRVSLWMEAVEPGRPLSFLDSHIQRGNALLGATPELMAKGIPDAAFEPIEGDDKKTASLLKRKNRAAAEGQRGLDALWGRPADAESAEVANAVAALEAAPDASLEDVAGKQAQWEQLQRSVAFTHQKFVADAWCAAFVWPKPPTDAKKADPAVAAAPTNELWRQLRDGQGKAPSETVKTVRELANQYHFFHWHLAFPQVFARGGFDVVLGNPPWDSLLFREEEFFAGTRPDIAQAATAAVRKKKIAKLAEEDPRLLGAYHAARRLVDGANAYVRSGVAFPLCGVGRVNLFGLFAELGRSLVGKCGRLGQILPAGIVTDDSTKGFFQSIVEAQELAAVFHFENESKIFPGVHHAFRFVLLVLDKSGNASHTTMQFFVRSVQELAAKEQRFTLAASDFALLNPATKTCPTFRTRRDAEINSAIYRRFPVFTRSGWKVELRRLLNSADDSGSFVARPGPGLLPLYEGKYFHHYDHRWVTNDGEDDRELSDEERADPRHFIRPRHWYPAKDVAERFGASWKHSWAVAWRDITGTEKQRTFIAAVVPSLAVPHTAKVVFLDESQVPLVPSLLGNLGAFAFDYVSRQKVGGTHMSSFVVEQLPVLGPETYRATSPWDRTAPLGKWVGVRALELTCTAWDLEPFAKDIGYDGPPFRWDPERRFRLRAELDAAFFHLYGISHDDADYILETFPIVKKNDEKAHGEYRTKRVILQIYGEMAEATRVGQPYQTCLSPPPADPRVAHPPHESEKVIPLPGRPARRPRPVIAPAAAVVPNLATVAANAWTRPHTMERGEIQAAILAVLAANGSPMDRRQARLAALLCLEPHLLVSMLEETETAEWIRVVGDDAKKAESASLDATAREWGAALAGLRGRGRLLEDLQQGTWALGSGTGAIDMQGWPEGRAGFVVNVLRHLRSSTPVDAIILTLPTNVQHWLANAA